MGLLTTPIKVGAKAGSGILDSLGRYFDDVFYDKAEYDPRYSPRTAEETLLRPNVSSSVQMQDANRLALQDLEGMPYVTTMSDRTAAGGILEGIGGKQVAHGVDLTGGQDFMRSNQDMWASAPSVTPQMVRAANEMKSKTGVDPLFMPWRMSPTGGDFAHMTGKAMLSYAAQNMSKGMKKKLDADIKKRIPKWLGLDNPKSLNQYGAMPDKSRKELMNFMDKNYRDKGGISVTQARLAVSDQTQLNAPVSGFQNVGLFDLDKGVNPTGGNATYPSSVGGEYKGTLDTDVTAMDLNPERLARAVNKQGEFTSGPQGTDLLSTREAPRRAMEVGTWGGVIDEKLLRDLSDQGFKIDSNGYVTAVAGAGGLLAMSASDDSEAGIGSVVKRLIQAGYPESTAMKIATGELPMDYASRMARAKEQGFTEKAFHSGKEAMGQMPDGSYQETGRGILNVEPEAGGMFASGKTPEVSQSYTGNRDTQSPTSYPLLVNTNNFEKTDAMGQIWHDIDSPEVYSPNGDLVRSDFTVSLGNGVKGKEPRYEKEVVDTNRLARHAQGRGASGIVIDGVQDIGAKSLAMKEAINQSGLTPKEWMSRYGKEGGQVLAITDGSKARSSLGAAFDPDNIGSTNILGSNPAATLGALLFSGGIGQEAQGLAAHAQGNTDAYLTAEEKAYRDGRQEFDNFFSDDTGYDRADLLPFRVNEETGETEFATPEMIRGLLSAFYDYGQLPKSGILNPQSLEEMI